EQQPKIVQVAVVEGVLVVPFHFQRHTVLVEVDFVRRRNVFDVVHHNPRIESLSVHPSLRNSPSSLSAISDFRPPGMRISLLRRVNPRSTRRMSSHSWGWAAAKIANPLRHS